MGVFRLFRYFLNRYPKFYKNVSIKDRSHYCDCFLIDCNAIFHPVAREVYMGLQNGSQRLLDNPADSLSLEELEKKAFHAICNRIVEITKLVNPSKVLYLAIDGVAGLSKQSQQRKRRFQNLTENDGKTFDFKNITAGTKWMEKLCKFMFLYFDKLHQTNPEFSKLDIILNDVHIAGEGEHKLIRWMELDNKYKSYTIYSPDADIILLSMGLGNKNIYVLRENVYDDINGDYLIIEIYKLKKYIIDDIKWVSVEEVYDEERMIKDYVFFLILIGNDFLPSIPSLFTYAIERIQTIYVNTAVNVGYLLSRNNTINVPALTGFMKAMAEIEPELLMKKLSLRVIEPDSVLVNNVNRIEGTINMDSYRKDYYERNFPGVEIDKICEEYIKGMFFVIQYYLVSIPTYDWSYPYHYAPLFTDLSEFLEHHPNYKSSFRYRGPLKLVESLASVLHPSSFYLLPIEINQMLTLRKEFDPDFNETFHIDLEGKQNDYEGVPHISTVDYDKIKMLLNPFNLREKKPELYIWKRLYVPQNQYIKKVGKPVYQQDKNRQQFKPREQFKPKQEIEKKEEPSIDDEDEVVISF